MPVNATETRPGRGGGGLASKLFNKFDSDRKYDPFLDTDPVVQDSKEGMEALLSMCNAVEINSLFGALGFVVPCPRNAKEQQIMNYIREGGRHVGKRFADVLKFCWEGLLFEYLRTVGCPLRDREHDPRHFVMRYWRRSMLDPSVRPGFVPFYAKREVKKRNSLMHEDRDIRNIRAGLALREDVVKEAENKTREQHDYRFVLQYFSASRDLHRTLVANVNYLANEVEQLRANMDHSSESISIMEQQFVELETKYDQVVGGLVHRGAFQLTLEGTLYGMIKEGHVALKSAAVMAREVLDGMDTGPERFDGVDPEVVNGCSANESNGDGNNPYPTQRGFGSAAGGSDVGLAAVNQTEGRKRLEESKAGESGAAVDPEENGKQTWTAPRPLGGGSTRVDSERTGKNNSQDRGQTVLTEMKLEEGEEEGVSQTRTDRGATWGYGHDDGSYRRRNLLNVLGPCLGKTLETHRRACTRYSNQVAELEGQNAVLTARAAEASKLAEEATTEAKLWEAKHCALEQRLAEVEERSRQDLACAEERADKACSRTVEVVELQTEKLERATPTLVDMVTGFAPRETEELGAYLLQSLDIEPDLYAHIIATKRMFEADMESRAFEILEAERKIALAEAEATALEDAAAAAGGGGKKKKGERGRPKSRGKGGGGADKGKSGGSNSKTKSKSPTGKGAKRGAEKGSSKAVGGGAGKDKKPAGKSSSMGDGGAGKENKTAAAARKPSLADKKRSSSPAKKGAAGKGNKKKK
ncbi:unnamed protein product [Ectocarpus sp. 12 AP-2014]